MASNARRQQTMAKRNREQAVKEKAARKLEKKYAAAQERQAKAAEELMEQFGPRPAAPAPEEAEGI
jgi:hypothetical protein